ncbi:sensor histidine kinase [Spiractinospora alimapuensis]|uniref:sensor histidine kinase n=1 Tax=Spiractinospora alimapuensis TaxID=2820884 RepID=UPI001F3B68DB|nr:ATP-binding protein [Spiractinospora alimapuensis]QVQ52467.1 sensor histidine kinase [Spiractinospora alimapuensis]
MTPEQVQAQTPGRFGRFMQRLGLRRKPEPQAAHSQSVYIYPYPQSGHEGAAPTGEQGPTPPAQYAAPTGHQATSALPAPPAGGPGPGHHERASAPTRQPAAQPSAAPPAQAQPPQVNQAVPPQPTPPAPVQETPAPPAAPPPDQRPKETVVPPKQPEVARPDLTSAALASLAMRDLTLVESMLDIVEDLEDSTEDSELLSKLFKLDNLATRMRRNGENLMVLAGEEPDDSQMEPLTLLEVARGAISEIRDYERVHIGRLPSKAVLAPAADDMSHLLAELLDNSTAKSPEHAQVVISAQPMADGGILVAVEDEGIGMPADQLVQLNARLDGAPVLDEESMRHMGLYVVSRIADRHGLRVQLEARAFRGLSAFVVVPKELVRDAARSSVAEESSPRMDRANGRPMEVVRSAGPSAGDTPRTPRNPGSATTSAGLPRRSARHAVGNGASDIPATEPNGAKPANASPVTPAGLPRRGARHATDGAGGAAGQTSAAGASAAATGTDTDLGVGVNGSSSVTSAGLPRRSAREPRIVPPDSLTKSDETTPGPDAASPAVTEGNRAERIRDELGSFLDGERAAAEETNKDLQ